MGLPALQPTASRFACLLAGATVGSPFPISNGAFSRILGGRLTASRLATTLMLVKLPVWGPGGHDEGKDSGTRNIIVNINKRPAGYLGPRPCGQDQRGPTKTDRSSKAVRARAAWMHSHRMHEPACRDHHRHWPSRGGDLRKGCCRRGLAAMVRNAWQEYGIGEKGLPDSFVPGRKRAGET